ncbi:MAG: S-adenosylmethionine:tRNA ribosyltransferase-isomerase [Chloroflexi bacterium]|nr:S-adenosylmethionine:tRNA ribosyltransferase-isomerase [Chloroflexota bacterium]
MTNFHLPRTSVLFLAAAFTGRELLLRAYQEAIAQRYRFLSFGDATLILCAAAGLTRLGGQPVDGSGPQGYAPLSTARDSGSPCPTSTTFPDKRKGTSLRERAI